MRSIDHIAHNRRMDVKRLPRYTITCETDGKTDKGTYWVAARILAVSTGLGGSKSEQVGTTEPEALAELLLLELVKAGKA